MPHPVYTYFSVLNFPAILHPSNIPTEHEVIDSHKVLLKQCEKEAMSKHPVKARHAVRKIELVNLALKKIQAGEGRREASGIAAPSEEAMNYPQEGPEDLSHDSLESLCFELGTAIDRCRKLVDKQIKFYKSDKTKWMMVVYAMTQVVKGKVGSFRSYCTNRLQVIKDRWEAHDQLGNWWVGVHVLRLTRDDLESKMKLVRSMEEQLQELKCEEDGVKIEGTKVLREIEKVKMLEGWCKALQI